MLAGIEGTPEQMIEGQRGHQDNCWEIVEIAKHRTKFGESKKKPYMQFIARDSN